VTTPLTPTPREWINPILAGNVQADLLRMGASAPQIEAHYLLPVPTRLHVPTGRFALSLPVGARLSEARLIARREANERLGFLDLVVIVPKIKAGTAPLVIVLWPGGEEANHPFPLPEPDHGAVRRVIGSVYWTGMSYRIYAEDLGRR